MLGIYILNPPCTGPQQGTSNNCCPVTPNGRVGKTKVPHSPSSPVTSCCLHVCVRLPWLAGCCDLSQSGIRNLYLPNMEMQVVVLWGMPDWGSKSDPNKINKKVKASRCFTIWPPKLDVMGPFLSHIPIKQQSAAAALHFLSTRLQRSLSPVWVLKVPSAKICGLQKLAGFK